MDLQKVLSSVWNNWAQIYLFIAEVWNGGGEVLAEGLLCKCSYLYVVGLETFGPNLTSLPRGNKISDRRKGIVFPSNILKV